jgi:hypothetical protein
LGIEEEVYELIGMCGMEAYEFYWLDPKGGYQIIGVLPEKRKNSKRIT